MTPDRIRIAHPRTDAARTPAARTPTGEIEQQTAVGQWYIASLIRSQRRLAATVTIAAIGGLMAVAAASALWPGWSRWRLLGISAPWLVLGLGVYPVMIAAAALAVRHAERNERAFVDLIRHQ